MWYRVLRSLFLASLLNLPTLLNAAPSSEAYCLAANIYNEARGEPYLGKLAIAVVTINRARSGVFSSDICAVVYDKKQFSWTNNKLRLEPTREDYMIAALALSGEHELKDFDALYFHAVYVKPGWKLTRIRRIHNHIFYK